LWFVPKPQNIEYGLIRSAAQTGSTQWNDGSKNYKLPKGGVPDPTWRKGYLSKNNP
jgi:hypothetical protein